MRKVKVTPKWPRTNPAAIKYARHIATQLQNNAYFPSPPVPIATLFAHVEELEAAEAATLTRKQGEAETRNAKRAVVRGDVDQIRAYVEAVANTYPIEQAFEVAVSSGLHVKRLRGPGKWAFSAEQGLSGQVKLYAPRRHRAESYEWRYSIDGVHWIDHGRTNDASTLIPNLKPGTLYSFQYRTLLKNVLSDWSDTLTFMPT